MLLTMDGRNILAVRIDNRLVHGQVGVTWAAFIRPEVIVLADDAAAEDTLQQRLMRAIIDPMNIQLKVFSIGAFPDALRHTADERRVFLVVRNIEELARIVDQGVALREVNLGNLHYEHGKKPLTRKVYINDSDARLLQHLMAQGIRFYAQDIPGTAREEINDLDAQYFRRFE